MRAKAIAMTIGAAVLLTAALTAGETAGIPGLKEAPRTLEEARAAADRLEKLYAGKPQPEAVRMFIAIVRGSRMLSGEGWFGLAQTRYTWAWLAEKCGSSPKAGIPRDKFKGPPVWFARLDRNKDGRITAEDLDWSDRSPWVQQSYLVNRLFRRMDATGAGRLTKKDLLEFFDKAAGGKDHLTADDLRDALLAGLSGGFAPGDAPKPEVLLRGLFAGEIGSLHEGPKLGDVAPDFEVKGTDQKTAVKLSRLVGERPVVLVFGNFTCGPFRSMYPAVEEVRQRYAKDATFVMVYVREAHPTDGWRMQSNDQVGVAVAQPRTTEARCEVAREFEKRLEPAIPLVVDEIDDRVGNAYSGMPARLYVLDRQGKVAYKSGRGPFGFKVGEMEQALVMALLEGASDRFPQLNDEAAWRRLPREEPALPAWARALADSLPRGTARLLELDHLHRAKSPLGAELRGKLRWVAADANGCVYARRYAEADLRRAGLKEEDLKRLAAGSAEAPEAERAALAFARKLTRAAYTVTDEEVAALVAHYGAQRVVAIVHTIAFANFQDRLLLGLGVEVEPGGPLPPLAVRLGREARAPVPKRWPWAGAGVKAAVPAGRPDWGERSFTDLEQALERQKARKARIPMPDLTRLTNLPPAQKEQAGRIVWSSLSLGYQPALTGAWFDCMAAFRQDARLDPVFANTLFWVVTRSNECFY